MKWVYIGLVVIVVAVGGFFVINNLSDNESSDNSEVVSSESSETTELASINSLLARGENAKCTYNYTDDAGNNSQGTAYFTNNRMYGDFSVNQTDGTSLQSKVLRLDNTQYVWDSTTNEGYKIDLSVIETQEGEYTESTEQNEAVDQDQEFEFKCVSWDVDESLFQVPSGINFIDNSQLIQGIQQNTDQLMNACANITDPTQRAACERAAANVQ
ncbi:hypothetical protein KC950_02860 [Candidatus Saccharibacteria bacterium]|nr:hypothetical protein [Candidatus Saccharibacteria bacterium]